MINGVYCCLYISLFIYLSLCLFVCLSLSHLPLLLLQPLNATFSMCTSSFLQKPNKHIFILFPELLLLFSIAQTNIINAFVATKKKDSYKSYHTTAYAYTILEHSHYPISLFILTPPLHLSLYPSFFENLTQKLNAYEKLCTIQHIRNSGNIRIITLYLLVE